MNAKNEIHLANKKRWDAASAYYAREADSRGIWRRCANEPQLALCDKEIEHLGDISGKSVAVLGNGDNEVVFALAGLGASMTSVDLSQNQLDIAERRARRLGLSISFVQADVTDLSVFEDGSFGVVYTGGHVAVWVADLETYYSEAVRILEPAGLFIVDEYHPFRRIWQESKEALAVESRYLERGPFEYDLSDDILRPTPSPLKSYEFHWTVADYINAVMKAGCHFLMVDEYGEEVYEWEGAPPTRITGVPSHWRTEECRTKGSTWTTMTPRVSPDLGATEMTGLKRHTVRVAEHEPEWANVFTTEARALREIVGELVLDIQHVGSTAVLGLPAKPIIDIAVANRIARSGYIDRGDCGPDGGYLLIKESGHDVRSVHLHIVEESDRQWRNYIYFRDALRKDPEARRQYANLKRRLAEQFRNDRRAYTAAKNDFIQKFLNTYGRPDKTLHRTADRRR